MDAPVLSNPKNTSQSAPLEKILTYLRTKKIRPYISGKNILDFGCGAHLQTIKSVKDIVGATYGYDILYKGIPPQKLADGTILYGSLDEIKARINLVVSLACFEHLEVEEFIGCLKKMSEVLDPECKIIGTVPRPPVKPILEALAFFGFISRTLVADHKFYYDRTTLAATVARGGWKLSKYESFQFGFNSMFILERDPAYNID